LGSLNGKGVGSKLGIARFFVARARVGGTVIIFGGIGCAGRVTGVRPGLWFFFRCWCGVLCLVVVGYVVGTVREGNRLHESALGV
jgi:hypothetical protein